MFLHPRQVSMVMAAVEGVADYRFVVDRINHRDVLRCEVVPVPGADFDSVTRDVRSRVRDGLRFDIEVLAVAEPTAADGPIADVRTWE
jgi:phenylacetate-CoA ligase